MRFSTSPETQASDARMRKDGKVADRSSDHGQETPQPTASSDLAKTSAQDDVVSRQAKVVKPTEGEYDSYLLQMLKAGATTVSRRTILMYSDEY